MNTAPANPTLAGQIALITGASRGYGAAIAQHLANLGAHVILLARTVGALEELDDRIKAAGGTATLMPFDLLKLDEIAALGPLLFERFGRLDIFIGNAAALGHFGPVAQFDHKTWQRVFDLGFTANQRLIQTLDPLLRASPAGRAVFITDLGEKPVMAYGGAYSIAKAALDRLVLLYAAETAGTRLRVNLLDPGPLQTALRAQGFPGEDKDLQPKPDTLTAIFTELCSPNDQRHGERIKLRP
jgi:NAD(P)-dependent dehydrogenase (short-subunit alcohol dehydrogenase family)